MSVRILHGDCRDVMASLPDQSLHCCVTSPPYFGLRDYGHDDQIGLESSPAEYVEQLVAVFREVRRVLRDDGTLWLNLGDSYAATTKGSSGNGEKQRSNAGTLLTDRSWRIPDGLKPKDLVGIPWRVAFALQADGWWLRQDIIWHKPNPMPESVRDRCTKAHEYLFLLAKSERYYFDADAIAEASVDPDVTAKRYESAFGGEKARAPVGNAGIDTRTRPQGMREFAGKRNKRSVWSITTQPYSESHFATMPPDLAETCIKAGCPAGGIVLDPFGGAGTTGLVADRLQRSAIVVELNPAYVAMARDRIQGDAPLFAEVVT
ncbi:MAG TPA: site-specific DNA-methyltransferase [Burkholderiaceae bacterium]|nr:site-specific DNA-methyltransferase [Burkholderiaceae bacterium]